jgi:hypothetical protein
MASSPDTVARLFDRRIRQTHDDDHGFTPARVHLHFNGGIII